jgi:Cu/Ag efflux pump CusA
MASAAYAAVQFSPSLSASPPVLMTALALIPLTLDPQASGKEILYPVATVILGGLISSTLLDMIVTPVVFYVFGERALMNMEKARNQGKLEI